MHSRKDNSLRAVMSATYLEYSGLHNRNVTTTYTTANPIGRIEARLVGQFDTLHSKVMIEKVKLLLFTDGRCCQLTLLTQTSSTVVDFIYML
ncbi:hypothetical protein RRG08_036505 [Elysia crispata]|uniref:Uncharacterized protein n=1 Tax=Elysia crispata TaxID=231223 RepID=A0AAE0ZLD8_9GAST|nr:hypothetical protein RRG08_036505 [Elysia crispata]